MKLFKLLNLKPAMVMLSLVFILSQAAWPQAAWAAETDARSISIFKIEGGDVKMSKGTPKEFTAKESYQLNDGYTVSTGLDSFCYIQMDEDSLLKMDERSRIAVSKKSKDKLSVTVQSGAALVDAGKQAENQVMETRVGNTGLTVRGTVYVMGLQGEGSAVITMLEGAGDVDGNPLPAGASMTVRNDGRNPEKQYEVTRGLTPQSADLFTAEALLAYSDMLVAEGHLTREQVQTLPQVIERKTEEVRIEKENIARDEPEVNPAVSYALPTPMPVSLRNEILYAQAASTPAPAPQVPAWVPPSVYVPSVELPTPVPPTVTTPAPGTPQPTDSGSPQPTDSGSPQPTDSGGPQPTDSGGPQPTDTGGPQPTDSGDPGTSDALSIKDVTKPINVQSGLDDPYSITPIKSNNGYSERVATFTVAVSGFDKDSDADHVELDISFTGSEQHNLIQGLKVDGHNTSESAIGGIRTYNVRIEYANNASGSTRTDVNVGLVADSLPQGYTFEGGGMMREFNIYNGIDTFSPIPVTEENIVYFNEYANTAEGLGRHYRQTEDITLQLPMSSAPPQNWTPIGSITTPFSGTYDGGFHTLTNLMIQSGNPNPWTEGLFGAIGSKGTLRNLGIIGARVMDDKTRMGIAAGQNDGVIEQCYVADGYIHHTNGSSDGVGGLVGVNNGKIRNCYAGAQVEGANITGGLVGENSSSGIIAYSYTLGSVSGNNFTGGIVGENPGSVTNSVALVASVTGGNPYPVMGASSGTAGNNYNNYARPGMDAGSSEGNDTLNGEIITELEVGETFAPPAPGWWSADNFDQAWNANGAWTIISGSLPVLSGFAPGTQSPTLN